MSTADKESAAAAQYGAGVPVNAMATGGTGDASAPPQQQQAPPQYVAYAPSAPAAGAGAGQTQYVYQPQPQQPMMAIPAGAPPAYMAGPPPAYHQQSPPQAHGTVQVQPQYMQSQQPMQPTFAQQMTPNFSNQQYYPGQPVAVAGAHYGGMGVGVGVSQTYHAQPPLQQQTLHLSPQQQQQMMYHPQQQQQQPQMGSGGPSYPPTGAGSQYPGAIPQQPMMARDGQPGAAAAAAGGGYPGNVPQQQLQPGAPGTTTVVYTQHVVFGTQPQPVTCAQCRYQGPSMVTHKPGNGTYLLCCGLACVGCWLGCCLIPFCVPELQDAYHQCPQCKVMLGRRMMMG